MATVPQVKKAIGAIEDVRAELAQLRADPTLEDDAGWNARMADRYLGDTIGALLGVLCDAAVDEHEAANRSTEAGTGS